MERHGRGRKPPPLSVAKGDDTASDDNEKKGRRHYCFSLRYFLQRKQTRQQVRLLFLLVVGTVSLLQVTRNVNVNFHLHKTDSVYASRPRVMGYYFRDSDSHSWIGTERLDFLSQPHLSHTTIDVSKKELRRQLHLLDSSAYDDGRSDEFEVGDCKAQYQWQLESYPTCNLLHEHDLGLVSEEKVDLLGNGYWRDVWKITDGGQVEHVLKTLRYEHDYEDRNYDRHRRDALATLRMTASPSVIDIYAYCGNSGIFEYAYGGDMDDMIWYSDSKWNSTERLIVAYQVATAIADVHLVEENGRPSIAHTDITTSQFVYVNGRYKLNDFNRCRFIAWNQKTNEQCGFYVGRNPGHFRSPEEYNYEAETEKVDVYSMGNVFYVLMTEQWPFNGEESKDVERQVKSGKRPHIPQRLRESTDPAYIAIRKVMAMCWRQDPKERATAKEVADILLHELKALNEHSHQR